VIAWKQHDTSLAAASTWHSKCRRIASSSFSPSTPYPKAGMGIINNQQLL
jgi:hypothetical protein